MKAESPMNIWNGRTAQRKGVEGKATSIRPFSERIA